MAANSSSGFIIYGTVNYSGSGEQIMLPNNYKGVVTLSGSGCRYQLSDMNYDNTLNIQNITYYPADHDSFTWGSGSTVSGGTNSDNSPYRGGYKSQRWQSILLVSDLNGGTFGTGTGINAGDYLRSLSFDVASKVSSTAFKNFTIKMKHTNASKICQLNCAGVGNFLFEDITGATTVFSPQDVTTTSGWNNHLFNNDFQWNGTQNILVEITWTNSGFSIPGGDDEIYYTDGVYSEDMMITNQSSTGDYTSISFGQNYNARPNILINYVGTIHNITIAKDWNNTTGTFVAKGNTVTFDGSTGIHATVNQQIRTNDSHFYNAIFTNPSGYTLSTNNCVVENTLTMTDGNYTTGTNILQLGTSTSVLGTLSYTSGTVIGYFKRWFASSTVSNVLFPVGTATYYRPANISFTGAPTGGSLTALYTSGNAGTNNVDLVANPIDDGGYSLNKISKDGYWTISAADALAGGTYSLDLTCTGISGVTDYSKLHMLKRSNSAINWAALGSHSVATGSNSIPIIHRTGLSGFSDFVPATGAENSLPVELLNFRGKCLNSKNVISWSTASEINNDYFLIEKSSNLIDFSILKQVKGNGNTNSISNYSTDDLNHFNTIYYRLKQVDFDGKETIYNPISVTCNNERNSFEIYYSNQDDRLILNTTLDKSQDITVKIYTVEGKLLSSELKAIEGGTSSNYIEMNHFSMGMYLLVINTNNDVISKKIVKK